jgi:hypothetical protein
MDKLYRQSVNIDKNGFSDVRASFLKDFPNYVEKIPLENNGI